MIICLLLLTTSVCIATGSPVLYRLNRDTSVSLKDGTRTTFPKGTFVLLKVNRNGKSTLVVSGQDDQRYADAQLVNTNIDQPITNLNEVDARRYQANDDVMLYSTMKQNGRLNLGKLNANSQVVGTSTDNDYIRIQAFDGYTPMYRQTWGLVSPQDRKLFSSVKNASSQTPVVEASVPPTDYDVEAMKEYNLKSAILKKAELLKNKTQELLSDAFDKVSGWLQPSSGHSDCPPIPDPPTSKSVPKKDNLTYFKIIVDFQRNYCDTATKSNPDSAYLEQWENYIAKKWDKATPEQQQDLLRARDIDLMARTATFESTRGGCSAESNCERNVILLTMKNRADSSSSQSNVYGARYPGDYSGVATYFKHYNVWISKTVRGAQGPVNIGACFYSEKWENDIINYMKKSEICKSENMAEIPASQQRGYKKCRGLIKYDFEKIPIMYQTALQQADQLLQTSNENLTSLFKGASLNDLRKIKHYYHPYGMSNCNPNDKKSGFECNPGGLSKSCENKRTHRLFPSWAEDAGAKAQSIQCANTISGGNLCQFNPQKKGAVEVGGDCNPNFMLIGNAR